MFLQSSLKPASKVQITEVAHLHDQGVHSLIMGA